MRVCSVSMRFAAARYFLALSMEESVRSYGPAHVLDNTPLVPFLENAHFYRNRTLGKENGQSLNILGKIRGLTRSCLRTLMLNSRSLLRTQLKDA
jgi:hypothetical protein